MCPAGSTGGFPGRLGPGSPGTGPFRPGFSDSEGSEGVPNRLLDGRTGRSRAVFAGFRHAVEGQRCPPRRASTRCRLVLLALPGRSLLDEAGYRPDGARAGPFRPGCKVEASRPRRAEPWRQSGRRVPALCLLEGIWSPTRGSRLSKAAAFRKTCRFRFVGDPDLELACFPFNVSDAGESVRGMMGERWTDRRRSGLGVWQGWWVQTRPVCGGGRGTFCKRRFTFCQADLTFYERFRPILPGMPTPRDL